jgi:hypothetical protein
MFVYLASSEICARAGRDQPGLIAACHHTCLLHGRADRCGPRAVVHQAEQNAEVHLVELAPSRVVAHERCEPGHTGRLAYEREQRLSAAPAETTPSPPMLSDTCPGRRPQPDQAIRASGRSKCPRAQPSRSRQARGVAYQQAPNIHDLHEPQVASETFGASTGVALGLVEYVPAGAQTSDSMRRGKRPDMTVPRGEVMIRGQSRADA